MGRRAEWSATIFFLQHRLRLSHAWLHRHGLGASEQAQLADSCLLFDSVWGPKPCMGTGTVLGCSGPSPPFQRLFEALRVAKPGLQH